MSPNYFLVEQGDSHFVTALQEMSGQVASLKESLDQLSKSKEAAGDDVRTLKGLEEELMNMENRFKIEQDSNTYLRKEANALRADINGLKADINDRAQAMDRMKKAIADYENNSRKVEKALEALDVVINGIQRLGCADVF